MLMWLAIDAMHILRLRQCFNRSGRCIHVSISLMCNTPLEHQNLKRQNIYTNVNADRIRSLTLSPSPSGGFEESTSGTNSARRAAPVQLRGSGG